MRIVETALWPLEELEPFGKGVYIGQEQRPDLAGLIEGERVLLVEPNEVQIEGIVHKVTLNGRVLWFGALQGEYQVIYQEATKLEH